MVSLDKIIISNNQPVGSNSLWIKPNPQKNGLTQMSFYVPYDKNKYTEVVSGGTSDGSGAALDFNKLDFDYSSEDKKIKFTFPTSKTTTKDFEIDCTDFIKDGMVNDVQFSEETGKISITFNTDSGKDSIELDAYRMFKLLSGKDSDTISVVIDNNKVSANIKNSSISEELLDESVKNSIKNAYEVIEFEDPNMEKLLLDNNIGGSIIPNKITYYEASQVSELPVMTSPLPISFNELQYFTGLTIFPNLSSINSLQEITVAVNTPGHFYRYYKGHKVTCNNITVTSNLYLTESGYEIILNNCIVGSSVFNSCANLKVTLNNCTIAASHVFNSCNNCIIIVKGSITINSHYLSNRDSNTFYIQDNLYNDFIQKASTWYISGTKKKLSEYYDKVQISEGTEEGTIHVSGERGLSKDVKVTGWDELKESSKIPYITPVSTVSTYSKEVSTDLDGTIELEDHLLDPKKLIDFRFKAKDDQGLFHEILINHSISSEGFVKWDLLKAYSRGDNATILLTGESLVPTSLEEELMNVFAYGIEWEVGTESTISPRRIGNLELHKSLPVQSKMRGCIWTKDDGIKYYLNPDNWLYKADGSLAVLTGEDGDVCVHIPTFYGRVVTKKNIRQIWISEYRISENWIMLPSMVIGAFRNMLIGDKLRSIISPMYRGGTGSTAYDTTWGLSTYGKPKTYLTLPVARQYARNNNMEILNYEYYKWIFCWLPSIEYCTFSLHADFVDSLKDGYKQGGLGKGLSSGSGWNQLPLVPNGFGIGNILTSRNILPLQSKFANVHKGNYSFACPIISTDVGFTLSKDSTISSYRGLLDVNGDVWYILEGLTNVGLSIYSTTDSSKYEICDKSSAGLDYIGNLPGIYEVGVYTHFYNSIQNQTLELFPESMNASGDKHFCSKANYATPGFNGSLLDNSTEFASVFTGGLYFSRDRTFGNYSTVSYQLI